MKPDWKKCGNCCAFELVGDGGECRKVTASVPTLALARMWPPVSPDDWCEMFSYNPEPLLAEIERLNERLAKAEFELDQLRQFRELCDDVDQDNGRVALPVLTNTEE